jgi:hypothetical protein
MFQRRVARFYYEYIEDFNRRDQEETKPGSGHCQQGLREHVHYF